MSARLRVACLVALAAFFQGRAASAHDGPPYPIVVDVATGPVLLTVWTDPDVGTGTFYLYLEPLQGRPLPDRATLEVFVQPVGGRLAEKGYEARLLRQDDDRQRYEAKVDFDAVGKWRTRIVVQTPGGGGSATKIVDVTPPGQGPVLDFVLYLFPVVAVGGRAVRAVLVSRRRLPPVAPPKP